MLNDGELKGGPFSSFLHVLVFRRLYTNVSLFYIAFLFSIFHICLYLFIFLYVLDANFIYM